MAGPFNRNYPKSSAAVFRDAQNYNLFSKANVQNMDCYPTVSFPMDSRLSRTQKGPGGPYILLWVICRHCSPPETGHSSQQMHHRSIFHLKIPLICRLYRLPGQQTPLSMALHPYQQDRQADRAGHFTVESLRR